MVELAVEQQNSNVVDRQKVRKALVMVVNCNREDSYCSCKASEMVCKYFRRLLSIPMFQVSWWVNNLSIVVDQESSLHSLVGDE